MLGRATIDATGCVRELKKKGATIQLYWTPSVWGAGGSAGGEHLQEVCQAETCGEVFPQNLFDQVEDFLTDGHYHFPQSRHSEILPAFFQKGIFINIE